MYNAPNPTTPETMQRILHNRMGRSHHTPANQALLKETMLVPIHIHEVQATTSEQWRGNRVLRLARDGKVRALQSRQKNLSSGGRLQIAPHLGMCLSGVVHLDTLESTVLHQGNGRKRKTCLQDHNLGAHRLQWLLNKITALAFLHTNKNTSRG